MDLGSLVVGIILGMILHHLFMDMKIHKNENKNKSESKLYNYIQWD